jgi:hypothetical protein
VRFTFPAFRRFPTLAIATMIGGAACAETTASLPPPEELLLVVNTGDATLSLIPISAASNVARPSLGTGVPADARPAAGRRFAVVAAGQGDSLAVVDLRGRRLVRAIALGPGSGARGIALVNDSTAYVALSRRDLVMRVGLVGGDTASVPVGAHPRDVVLTRGKLFVINANALPCPPPDELCPAGESWVTVVDPASNTRASGRDSIPLPGPGNAGYATIGGDGRVYVMSVGGGETPEARLSIVDPVTRSEVGSFGGFGVRPGPISGDRGERIMVSSRTEGLMEFNTRTRTVVRGAGNGIPLTANSGVAIDSRGFVYGIEAGPCIADLPGQVRVFREDLTETDVVGLGSCAGAATTALIPPPEDAAVRR